MLDQEQIAKATQLVPGVGDHTVFRRNDGGASRGRDVDSIVMSAIPLRTESRNLLALKRPKEATTAPWWRRGYRRNRCRLARFGLSIRRRCSRFGWLGNVFFRGQRQFFHLLRWKGLRWIRHLAGRGRCGGRLGQRHIHFTDRFVSDGAG